MRILVTGAAGFFGRYITKQLVEEGHDVLALDTADGYQVAGHIAPEMRGPTDWVMADITQPRLDRVVPDNLDAVIHLAAIAAPGVCAADPARAYSINVAGTHNVLELARIRGARRFVFASTAHVYGISPRYMPTDEQHPLWLGDVYTATKALGEDLCRIYGENYGLSTVSLRVYNGYGPGQAEGFFIPDMIKKARAGKIALTGAGITKDWVYVTDVADAYCRAVRSEYVGAVNVGTGDEMSLGAIAMLIAARFGAVFEALPGEGAGPTRMLCDPRKALRLWGWRPLVSIDTGLLATLDAAQQQEEATWRK